MLENNFGIYVHIPFCVSKCNYCSFVSKNASCQEIQKYIDFLCDEIEIKSKLYKDKVVSSIYFGGGTPSFINDNFIKKIMVVIKSNYVIKNDAEISIECNPCSTTLKKLKTYKEVGINRISFGVQSMNDKLLKIIGRKHSSKMVIDAITTAKEVGFKNISCDLMIGIPNQTKEDLIESFNILQKQDIMHISAYMLMLEEGTKLYDDVKSGKLKVASDDDCVEMYNELEKSLKQYEFNRYEISNFSKKNFECKHNINYWDMGEYLGFGVSAHSFVKSVRFANFNDFDGYYKSINFLKNNINLLKNNEKNANNVEFYNKNAYFSYESLSKEQIIEETIMLGLRQEKGVSVKKLNNLGYDILTKKKDILLNLKNNNILNIGDDYIKINSDYFGVCNLVILELLD